MATQKTTHKNSILGFDDDDDTGQTGRGGAIEFHDFVSSNAHWRDDELPFDERKRLLMVHQDVHELKVKAQKEKREHYRQLKEGKMSLETFRENYGANAQYKPNPILADKAQFSGSTDRQVNQLPNENIADTNPEQRNELRNELTHRLQYRPDPMFNPKPRGPGY